MTQFSTNLSAHRRMILDDHPTVKAIVVFVVILSPFALVAWSLSSMCH